MSGAPATRYRLPRPLRAALCALVPIVCPAPPDAASTGGASQPAGNGAGDPAVIDHLEHFLGALPAPLRLALAAGTALFELAALVWPRHGGRRFSRLEHGRAEAYYRAWRHSRFGLLRQYAHAIGQLLAFSYYEQPSVQEALDYHPARWIERVRQRRLESYAAEIREKEAELTAPDRLPGRESRPRLGPLASAAFAAGEPGPEQRERSTARVYSREDVPRDTELDCDVVIVGSGAGGATLAAELAEEGLDVVVLEEGHSCRTEDFGADVTRALRELYRDGGGSMALGSPPVLFQEGRTVGGSAVVNGGMAWRTPEKILARWEREAGLTGVARELDACFERVERRIHVAHQDPETIGRDNELLRSGADALGWKWIANRRNQLHCAGSNNCALGCPTGAKRTPLVTYVPRALHFGARIHSDVRVERILFRGRRAVGVAGRVLGADGRRKARLRVRARLVVSAGGAIQTPYLLLRSGVRSLSGRLGRELSLHPNAKVVAVFGEDVRGWEGVHQAFQVRQFQDEGLVMAAVNVPPAILAMGLPRIGSELHEIMQDYNRIVTAGILVEDTSTGRVWAPPGGRPITTYQVSDRDGAQVQRGTALLCELLFAAGARRIHLPFAGVGTLQSADDARRLLARPVPKRTMELLTVHLMGTARMGADSRHAVCDGFGHVHGYERLMVSDASLFPTPIGVNPALTIQALATRNAAHILDDPQRHLG